MAKSEERPRADVVWTLIGDGLEPKPAPWGYVVRNPLAMAVPPKTTREVRLGVAANVPMFVWPRGDMAEYAKVIGDGGLHQPGRELRILIENKSEHAPLLVDDLEPLLNIHPLIFKGTAEVG